MLDSPMLPGESVASQGDVSLMSGRPMGRPCYSQARTDTAPSSCSTSPSSARSTRHSSTTGNWPLLRSHIPTRITRHRRCRLLCPTLLQCRPSPLACNRLGRRALTARAPPAAVSPRTSLPLFRRFSCPTFRPLAPPQAAPSSFPRRLQRRARKISDRSRSGRDAQSRRARRRAWRP